MWSQDQESLLRCPQQTQTGSTLPQGQTNEVTRSHKTVLNTDAMEVLLAGRVGPAPSWQVSPEPLLVVTQSVSRRQEAESTAAARQRLPASGP